MGEEAEIEEIKMTQGKGKKRVKEEDLKHKRMGTNHSNFLNVEKLPIICRERRAGIRHVVCVVQKGSGYIKS